MNAPVRPEDRKEEVDPEVERIVRERLATFDGEAKTALDARQAIAEIRKSLRQPAPR